MCANHAINPYVSRFFSPMQLCVCGGGGGGGGGGGA